MKSILSFQSSVTFGAVGNTMASVVMAEFGHHLCRADTIQLIAHPGYGGRAGGTLSDDDFKSLLNGLKNFALQDRVDSIMTGYMGTPDQVEMIADAIAHIQKSKEDCDVLVDPAFGDHGRLYVDPKIADQITVKLMPLADVMTPNFFEFEHMMGTALSSQEDVINAGQDCLARFPKLKAIAVTGCSFSDNDNISDIWIDHQGHTHHSAPSLIHNNGMSGGGDLFSALLMSIRMSGADWRDSFDNTAMLCRRIINGADKVDAKDINLEYLKNVLKDRA